MADYKVCYCYHWYKSIVANINHQDNKPFLILIVSYYCYKCWALGIANTCTGAHISCFVDQTVCKLTISLSGVDVYMTVYMTVLVDASSACFWLLISAFNGMECICILQ